MKYQFTLTFEGNLKKIFTKQGPQNRSEIKITDDKFIVAANDIVALKASLNSCLKALEIYAKTEKLVKND